MAQHIAETLSPPDSKSQASASPDQQPILNPAIEAYDSRNYQRAIELFGQYNWELRDDANELHILRGKYYNSLIKTKDYQTVILKARSLKDKAHPIDFCFLGDACLALYKEQYNKSQYNESDLISYLIEAAESYEKALSYAETVKTFSRAEESALLKFNLHCCNRLIQLYSYLPKIADRPGVQTPVIYAKLKGKVENRVEFLKSVKEEQAAKADRKTPYRKSPDPTESALLSIYPQVSYFFPLPPQNELPSNIGFHRAEKIVVSSFGATAMVGIPLFVFYCLEGQDNTLALFSKDLMAGIPVYAFFLIAFVICAFSVYGRLTLSESPAPIESSPDLSPAPVKS